MCMNQLDFLLYLSFSIKLTTFPPPMEGIDFQWSTSWSTSWCLGCSPSCWPVDQAASYSQLVMPLFLPGPATGGTRATIKPSACHMHNTLQGDFLTYVTKQPFKCPKRSKNILPYQFFDNFDLTNFNLWKLQWPMEQTPFAKISLSWKMTVASRNQTLITEQTA